MSIQSEINRMSTAKTQLRQVLEDNEVSVPAGTTLDGYPDLVETALQQARAPADGTHAGVVRVSDTPNASLTAAQGWAASPAAVQAVSKTIYMVRTYARYDAATNGRLLSVILELPQGISAGINQFGVAVEVEDEANCALYRFVHIGSGSATVYFKNPDGSAFSPGAAVWFNALIVVDR